MKKIDLNRFIFSTKSDIEKVEKKIEKLSKQQEEILKKIETILKVEQDILKTIKDNKTASEETIEKTHEIITQFFIKDLLSEHRDIVNELTNKI